MPLHTMNFSGDAVGVNGTESFNEANVSKYFGDVIREAEEVRKVLQTGNDLIDGALANSSKEDAYSGEAAAKIKEQWNGLASTFENFLSNFQNWYDQGVETAKANQALQDATAKVEDADN